MVKRIIDTSFWTDMHVIDNYSIEDKYFSLYLMTNDKTTQVGIYPLPKKVMSFETGFTTDVVQVLLDRFSEAYGKILYSKETQEVSVLHSLEHTIVKGGKPVSDLLERELSRVKDGNLILATYQEMKSFWELSKRKFDHVVQELFENELTDRGLIVNENDNQNDNDNDNDIYNENDNDNDNEESWATNRMTNRGANRQPSEMDVDELNMLEQYADFIKQSKPEFKGDITPDNILFIFYEQMIGKLQPQIENQLNKWIDLLPKSLILEALLRSVHADRPILYAASIVGSWKAEGVESYKDVIFLDKKHSGRGE